MNSNWAIYPWAVEAGIDLVHPADLENFKHVVNSSKVYEVMEQSEYITLRYDNDCYRVRKKLLKFVPAPKYSFGEVVKIKKNFEDAVITDIMWHYDKQEHYYFVSIDNRKKSKRYFETEFL